MAEVIPLRVLEPVSKQETDSERRPVFPDWPLFSLNTRGRTASRPSDLPIWFSTQCGETPGGSATPAFLK